MLAEESDRSSDPFLEIHARLPARELRKPGIVPVTHRLRRAISSHTSAELSLGLASFTNKTSRSKRDANSAFNSVTSSRIVAAPLYTGMMIESFMRIPQYPRCPPETSVQVERIKT